MFNIARHGCSAWSEIPAQLGAKQALNFAEIRNTRECKALVARRRFHGEDVAAVLTDLMSHQGRPATIQCDQGTEFTSLAMHAWPTGSTLPWTLAGAGRRAITR
ncbi:MAG: hypothetical protein ACYCVL_00280 [Gemmatimonadaceae bacterium]